MRKFFRAIALLVVYFLLMLLPAFLGFLSPALWFFYPVASALIASTPLMICAKKWKKFGGATIFPVFWYLLMVLMGELSFAEQWITPMVILAIAEIVRKQVGYETQMGLRLSYATASLVTAMQHLIILTRPDYYYQGAVEEMGSTAYAEAIVGFVKPGYFALLIAMTFVAGYMGTLLSEKLFTKKVTV